MATSDNLDLIQRLQAAKGDTQAQAAITAEFLILALPENERKLIRSALDAAAVLRWFDGNLLSGVLGISVEDARTGVKRLDAMPFVESYRTGGDGKRNIHDSTRLGWRKKLAQEMPERFRTVSTRAAAWFIDDLTPAGRIERIYHLLCGDPEQGATELETLGRDWISRAQPADFDALTTALMELEGGNQLEGRARVWSLLVILYVRARRGDVAQLEHLAKYALELAQSANDLSAEADAQCLLGDVLKAQGRLVDAHDSFGKCLEISQRLAEQNPKISHWQRELAVVHGRVGDVLQAQGELTQAEAAFGKYLAITRNLAEQDPSNAATQRELAVAYGKVGNVLQTQGKLSDAQIYFAEGLATSRRLAEQSPSNADSQRDLAVAYSKVGDIWRRQRNLSEAQLCLTEALAINRRLVEQDPSNAFWQRDLAATYGKMGDVLQVQGNLTEAQAYLTDGLAINRRLAEQDPSHAGWQHDLAAAYSKMGDVLQVQGNLIEAQACFAEGLAINRRLAEQDPSNASWQHDLAAAHSKMGDVLRAQNKPAETKDFFAKELRMGNGIQCNDGQKVKAAASNIPGLPRILEELMLRRSCVAYVGAGFSMACGMPGWEELLQRLTEHGEEWLPGKLASVKEAVKEKDLPMAASLLRTILPAAVINDCLNYSFGAAAYARAKASQREHMNGRMEKLVHAGWAGIVTTNYDRLIEQALWKLTEGADWLADIQIDGDASRLCEVLAGAREYRTFFVKLHGSITGARVVLSTEEYDETYLRSPQVSTFLQALILQYHLVFIGCSLEDEVVRIRRKLTADFKGLIPTSYAILPRNARNEARSSFLTTAASIEPIWYESSKDDTEHRGLDNVLDQFARIPKQPEDLRSLIRFRKLEDRFDRVSPRNKKLLTYIAGEAKRTVDLNGLVNALKEDANLKKRICSAELEDEIKYRLQYLMAIGLLWEDDTPDGKVFRIPPSLSDSALSRHLDSQ